MTHEEWSTCTAKKRDEVKSLAAEIDSYNASPGAVQAVTLKMLGELQSLQEELKELEAAEPPYDVCERPSSGQVASPGIYAPEPPISGLF